MNINNFLKDLIINNRRVIIPDLGAFLHTGEDDKEVAFSSFLRYNDEFLEKSLIKEFKISSFEATKIVGKLTDTINTAIKTYGRYSIEGFGYFISENDNISFVVDPNAVNDFTTNFIDVVKETKKVIPTPTPNISIQEVNPVNNANASALHSNVEQSIQPPKEKTFDKKKLFIISGVSLVAIFILVFLFLNNRSNGIDTLNLEKDILVDVVTKDDLKKPETVKPENTVTEEKIIPIQENKQKPVLEENNVADTIPARIKTPIVESTNTSNKTTGYHIIAGCFIDKLNAERFAEECLEKGFKDTKIIKKIGDLYPVSLLKFNNVSEATLYVNSNYEDDDLWVYKSF